MEEEIIIMAGEHPLTIHIVEEIIALQPEEQMLLWETILIILPKGLGNLIILLVKEESQLLEVRPIPEKAEVITLGATIVQISTDLLPGLTLLQEDHLQLEALQQDPLALLEEVVHQEAVVHQEEALLKEEGKISKQVTMKKIIFFVAFAAVSYTSYSQSLGYEDLSTMFSRNDRNGSARFVAMGGAFGAVGGDVTAMTINPAGISIFNDSNASIAFQSRSTDYLTTYYGNSTTTQQDFFKVSNAGVVFTFNNYTSDEWSKLAMGINYRVLADFEDTFITKGTSGFASFDNFPLDNSENPLVYDIADNQQLSNFYNGYMSELSFAFSGVYEEKMHVGAGLNFYDLNFSQQTILRENNNDGNNNTLKASLYQENFTTGVGFSLSAGVIYKPTNAFRLGLSYQSPTWFTEIIENTNITNNDGFFGDTEIEVSNDDIIYDNTFGGNLPTQGLLYKLRTPSKITASTAIIFGKFGLISLDYSTKNYRGLNLSGDDFSEENLFFDNQLRKVDALHLGTEWRIKKLSIRGGYIYEQSPDVRAVASDDLQSYSLGFGYNFGWVKFNLAYTNSNKTGLYDFYPQYNQVEAAELNIDNTMVTAGFSVHL